MEKQVYSKTVQEAALKGSGDWLHWGDEGEKDVKGEPFTWKDMLVAGRWQG